MEHVAHLKKDKKLSLIITEPYHELKFHKNISLHLIASIMSQQLNTKVADVIYRRFLDIYKGKEPTPKQVLNTPPETLRAIGLSNAKVSYVHNVARFCIEQGMDHRKLNKMDDEEVIVYLSQIKG